MASDLSIVGVVGDEITNGAPVRNDFLLRSEECPTEQQGLRTRRRIAARKVQELAVAPNHGEVEPDGGLIPRRDPVSESWGFAAARYSQSGR